MTNKHNNSSERILRETDHETQIHNFSRVLTNVNKPQTTPNTNQTTLMCLKKKILKHKHTSFRGNMNAEVTVKHLNISTHLIYTDLQNHRLSMKQLHVHHRLALIKVHINTDIPYRIDSGCLNGEISTLNIYFHF